MISLITALILAQSSVPSVVVQPSNEERVVFVHNGYTYFVGKQSGQVLVLKSGDDTKPPPIIDDEIKPIAKKAAWVSLIVDPASPEQAAWRTNSVVRGLLGDAGVEFRTYASTERDIDQLGFRSDVTGTGLPTVIIQDKSGKLIQAISPKSLEELKLIAAGLK